MKINRTSLATMRAAFSVALLVAPRLSARMWLGGDATTRRVRLVRLIGVRDAVLAGGLWLSGKPRPWLAAAAVADSADAIGSLVAAARSARRRTWATAALAAGGATVAGRLAADQ